MPQFSCGHCSLEQQVRQTDPAQTKFTTHMFLNKELVNQLTPCLEYFVETGELR